MAEVSNAETKPTALYVVEAPGVLRGHSEYNVAVTILNTTTPTAITVRIHSVHFTAEKLPDEMQPMSTKLLTFHIPEVEKYCEYELEVRGSGGVEFDERIMLNVDKNYPLVYIQLDKQAYKCEDHVSYRVVCLDTNMRPAHLDKPLKIVIKHDGEHIKEIDKVKLTQSIYTDQWLIPETANLGNYTIEAFTGDESVATKGFEVVRNVKPKFQVQLKTAKEVPYEKGEFNVTVEARYSDGKPVKGVCTVILYCVGGYYATGARTIKKSTPINGQVKNIIFNFSDDLFIESDFVKEAYFTNISYKLEAIIEEDKTQAIETLSELIVITKDDKNEDNCVNGCCRRNSESLSSCSSAQNSAPVFIVNKSGKIKAGEIAEFEVHLNKATNYFVYVVVSRGNIIKHELVNIDDHNRPQTIKIETDVSFVPRAFLLVYYALDGELYFDEIGFNLKKQFLNNIQIEAPTSAKVGDVVTLELKSSPNSIIGLMAVDEKSILLNASNELEYKRVFKDLFYVRSSTPWLDGHGRYPGLRAGLVTFTNANWEGFKKGDSDGTFQMFADREHCKIKYPGRYVDSNRNRKILIKELQKRNQVFGNLIFKNLQTDDKGLVKVEQRLPMKPTTWLVSGLSLNDETGFAFTKSPIRIEAQPIEPVNDSAEKALLQLPKTTADRLNFEVHHYENSEFREHIDKSAQIGDRSPIAIEFSITGNLLGPTIANLAKYAGTMYCTGHLHMTTLIPNVVVLEYLESIQQLDSELAVSIKKRFIEAIAREFVEQKPDGSFGWFSADESGSSHVTSYVLQGFQRASKYVDIDAEVIEKGLRYLAAVQTEAGDFKREPEPYKESFSGDSNVGLTALVVLAFLRNTHVTANYQSTIDKAFNYIIQHVESVQGIYDLVITFYAMQLAQHPYAPQLRIRLMELACKDDNKNLMWWNFKGVADDSSDYNPIHDIEITGYMLLALLETESVETIMPIVKYLIPWGTALNRFHNETMDAAIGLDAILKFAVRCGIPYGLLRVNYVAYAGDEKSEGIIELTADESRNVITKMLPKDMNKLEFWTTDKGSFVGHITYRYNKH